MLIFIMLTYREKQELVRAALLTDQLSPSVRASILLSVPVGASNTSSLRCRVSHALGPVSPYEL